ncbi:hypothetical protein BDV19DRAFT_372853 [Aspergillus venezuelensis]
MDLRMAWTPVREGGLLLYWAATISIFCVCRSPPEMNLLAGAWHLHDHCIWCCWVDLDRAVRLAERCRRDGIEIRRTLQMDSRHLNCGPKGAGVDEVEVPTDRRTTFVEHPGDGIQYPSAG